MATITEDYVSFEVAKLLKEKGFPQNPNMCNTAYTTKGKFSNNAKSFAFYYELFKPRRYSIAPTLQMAMKWLREVHNIYYDVQLLLGDKAEKYGDLQLGVYQLSSSGAYKWECWLYADTYEKLYEKYIKYCIEKLF